jgi:hypothetical protein
MDKLEEILPQTLLGAAFTDRPPFFFANSLALIREEEDLLQNSIHTSVQRVR